MNFLKKNAAWLIPIILMILITPLTPELDLKIERYFYEGGHFSNHPFYKFIFDYGGVPGEILGILAAVILFLSFYSKKWLKYRASSFVIVLTIAVGAAFIVHLVLKDHWGRPRPKQVIEFGGHQEFRPFYSPNIFNQPEPSKSFPCGHCTMGFCFFALILAGKRLNNKAVIVSGWIGLIVMGSTLSLARMAQGGHFFSDVLMCALIMWLTAYFFDWLVYKKVHF